VGFSLELSVIVRAQGLSSRRTAIRPTVSGSSWRGFPLAVQNRIVKSALYNSSSDHSRSATSANIAGVAFVVQRRRSRGTSEIRPSADY